MKVIVVSPSVTAASAIENVGGGATTGAVYIPRPCVAAISLFAETSSFTSMTMIGGSPVDVLCQCAPPSNDQSTPTSVAA